MNFGVEQSTGDYVLLLNNDMQVISPDFIEQLISPFALENVGVVGGKLLYRDGAIQHAGVVIGAFGSASHLHYNLPDGNPGYFHRADCIQDLSCVTGACQMISRKAYNQVGGYTPEFAVGYNDVDFCLKVRDAGMRVVYTPMRVCTTSNIRRAAKTKPWRRRFAGARTVALAISVALLLCPG